MHARLRSPPPKTAHRNVDRGRPVKALRILRVFRVIRVFGRVGQLREIVGAISRSILPAIQALVRVHLPISTKY